LQIKQLYSKFQRKTAEVFLVKMFHEMIWMGAGSFVTVQIIDLLNFF